MKSLNDHVSPSWQTRLLSSVAAVSILSTIAAVPSVAQDQDQDDESVLVEEVQVTGFRRSLLSAAENKRQANSVIESLSAEDIGRLPDISIAEALARLPGITTQRTGGQANAINIRGLPQDLTFSTLNGREQVSTSGSRVVEFEQFPSELISGADVFKSPQARLIEGGIAGTVDLKTLRPLEQSEDWNVTLNARGSFNDRANEIFDANALGYRLSLSSYGKFFDDTLGLVLGYSRLVQPDVNSRAVIFDFFDAGPENGFDADGNPIIDFNGDGANDAVSFGYEAEEQGGTETRDAVLFTAQWEPAQWFSLEVDGFYSSFDSETIARGFRLTGQETVNNSFGNLSGGITDPVLFGNAVIGGTFERFVDTPPSEGGPFGLTLANLNDDVSDFDELFTVGTQAEFYLGNWTFGANFTFSSAETFFTNLVSNTFLANPDAQSPGNPIPAEVGFEFGIQLNGISVPDLSVALDGENVDFTPDNTILGFIGQFSTENEDELTAVRGDVTYDFDPGTSFFSSFQAGFRFADRQATTTDLSTLGGFGNGAAFFGSDGLPIPVTGLGTTQTLDSDIVDADFPTFVALDIPAAIAATEAATGIPFEISDEAGFLAAATFVVDERIFAGYFQANFDSQLFGIPMRGNVGVRVHNTDQSSFNFAAQETLGINFTQVLPSGNFIFELTDNDIIRLAGSRAISRAPIDDLGAGVSISPPTTVGGPITGGSDGNPFLLPFLANQGEVTYEHYFENGGIFTVAGFYKQIASFIFGGTDPAFDFEAAGLLDGLSPDELATVGSFIGPFGGIINGEGGVVRGVEMAFTYTLDFLPPTLSGLGATFSYAYTDSSLDFEDTLSGSSQTIPLPGLSNHVANTTVFYDYQGLSTRLGIRYRSEFIAPQIGLSELLPFNEDELILDYQLSYQFGPESVLDGVTLLFQANNLTDEPTISFFGFEAQTGTIQFFGRQFFFGASYSF